MTAAHAIHLKRGYEDASSDDGFRILVERLWPRGVAKAEAGIDLGPKEIAPGAGRRWPPQEPEGPARANDVGERAVGTPRRRWRASLA